MTCLRSAGFLMTGVRCSLDSEARPASSSSSLSSLSSTALPSPSPLRVPSLVSAIIYQSITTRLISASGNGFTSACNRGFTAFCVTSANKNVTQVNGTNGTNSTVGLNNGTNTTGTNMTANGTNGTNGTTARRRRDVIQLNPFTGESGDGESLRVYLCLESAADSARSDLENGGLNITLGNGHGLNIDGADASSSASNRAFSALRASSARRFSSLSSLDLEDLAPSCHLDASLRSCILYG